MEDENEIEFSAALDKMGVELNWVKASGEYSMVISPRGTQVHDTFDEFAAEALNSHEQTTLFTNPMAKSSSLTSRDKVDRKKVSFEGNEYKRQVVNIDVIIDQSEAKHFQFEEGCSAKDISDSIRKTLGLRGGCITFEVSPGAALEIEQKRTIAIVDDSTLSPRINYTFLGAEPLCRCERQQEMQKQPQCKATQESLYREYPLICGVDLCPNCSLFGHSCPVSFHPPAVEQDNGRSIFHLIESQRLLSEAVMSAVQLACECECFILSPRLTVAEQNRTLYRILDALAISPPCEPTEDLYMIDDFFLEEKLTFQWSWEDGSSSVAAVRGLTSALKSFGLFAVDIVNGNCVPDGHLFEAVVYAAAGNLKKSRRVAMISGSTDIVVLREPASSGSMVLRHMVKFVIEIFEAKLFEINLMSCLLRASYVLLGMCANNPVGSPPVLITDGCSHFFVVYLSAAQRPLKYAITARHCLDLQSAVHLAEMQALEACLDFGSFSDI